MRIAYIGTSDFAAAVLSDVVAAGIEPALVVTRPDRPRGRGRRLESPPIAVWARERGIPLHAPGDVNAAGSVEAIAAVEADAVCVCAFGALLKGPMLSRFEMLNVHPSLLPRWRGAAPVERALMAGDEQTGVSIMRVTAGLDSGPVCLSQLEKIAPRDTYGTLAPRLARLGAVLLVRALTEQPGFCDQQESVATYAEKIGAADRMLDRQRSVVELERTVRALHPHIGARADLGDGMVCRVQRAAVAPNASAEHVESSVGDGDAFAQDGRLFLRCRDGALELLELQPPGGRPMAAADFLRGHARRW